MRVDVKADLLRWACQRSGLTDDEVQHRFPRFANWLQGDVKPTLKQLEAFAQATHTPIGYLFLRAPPVERIPIPDFRTVGNKRIGRPSPDLLDTIYICQQRQEWFRDYAVSSKQDQLPFVGAATTRNDVVKIASDIRDALDFSLERRRKTPTWTEALRQFIEQADRIGVLIMVNGVVANNNYRKLDPAEFRGFALSDVFAPLVFINGADTKAAQMFTLAHELAHVWLGQSALSDVDLASPDSNEIELWCNKVAAEILVPLEAFSAAWRDDEPFDASLSRMARDFKVSTLVILRRMFDAGKMSQEEFWEKYREELLRLLSMPKSSGGDFYLTQGARVGKRFARALIANTLEGQTLHRDAFRLLGFSKLATFRELGHSLGVI